MRGMFWRRPRASRECLHNGTHHFVRVQPSRRPFGCEYMPEPRQLLHQPRITERLLPANIVRAPVSSVKDPFLRRKRLVCLAVDCNDGRERRRLTFTSLLAITFSLQVDIVANHFIDDILDLCRGTMIGHPEIR